LPGCLEVAAICGLALSANFAFVATLPAAEAVAPPAAPIPLDQQPYRVRVEISFGVAAEFSKNWRVATLRGLGDALERSVGAMWQVEVREDSQSRPAGDDALGRMTAKGIAARYEATELDKVFLLSIVPSGSGLRIAGREWDAVTIQLGPIEERVFPDRREVATRLAILMRSLFRPIAAISQTKGEPVILRARAGALTPHDSTWQPLRSGAIFEAYFRYLNTEKAVERIQQIPWTYLTVGSADQGISDCTVTSALRANFAIRRRRLEMVALAAKRQVPQTRLTLITRPPTRRPLGGVEVEVLPEPAAKQESAPETPAAKPRVFVTDRNGQVTLASATQEKPQWLLVRSGQNVLARVPIVAGIRAEEVLELPDDTLRLEVEGQVSQLQSELVDTVARRAVMAAMIRNRAKTRQWDDVDGFLKNLQAMPGATEFAANLSAIRLNSVKTARSHKDKATELRIEKLCSETAELIKGYLDDDRIRELREEITELKKVAAEDAAAEVQVKKDQEALDAKQNSAPAAAAPQPPVTKPGF
jgi:hypothetical protein